MSAEENLNLNLSDRRQMVPVDAQTEQYPSKIWPKGSCVNRYVFPNEQKVEQNFSQRAHERKTN